MLNCLELGKGWYKHPYGNYHIGCAGSDLTPIQQLCSSLHGGKFSLVFGRSRDVIWEPGSEFGNDRNLPGALFYCCWAGTQATSRVFLFFFPFIYSLFISRVVSPHGHHQPGVIMSTAWYYKCSFKKQGFFFSQVIMNTSKPGTVPSGQWDLLWHRAGVEMLEWEHSRTHAFIGGPQEPAWFSTPLCPGCYLWCSTKSSSIFCLYLLNGRNFSL